MPKQRGMNNRAENKKHSDQQGQGRAALGEGEGAHDGAGGKGPARPRGGRRQEPGRYGFEAEHSRGCCKNLIGLQKPASIQPIADLAKSG